jgi:hypothetical protein
MPFEFRAPVPSWTAPSLKATEPVSPVPKSGVTVATNIARVRLVYGYWPEYKLVVVAAWSIT